MRMSNLRNGSAYKSRVRTQMRFATGTLGDAAAKKQQPSGSKYLTPQASKLSSACTKQRHNQCYVLACGCECH